MGLEELDLQSYVDYKVSEIMELKNKLGFRVTLIYADGSTKIREHGGFTKKADANAEKNSVISQLHSGVYVVHNKVKVKELLVYWLEYVMKPEETFKANSYHTYKNCIDKHINPKIGNLRLLSLNQGHLSKLYKELASEYVSIPRLAKTILNTAMTYALGKRLILNNPCKDVGLPKNVKKNEYHTLKIKETELLFMIIQMLMRWKI